MLATIIFLITIPFQYYYGIFSIKFSILILSTIYWIPKFPFIVLLNRLFPKIITNLNTSENFDKTYVNDPIKYISLTFDDVPYGSFHSILKILDKYNMKATFFIISDYVTEKDKTLLIDAINNGHQLGNHGKTASLHALHSLESLKMEIETCDKLINDLYKLAKITRSSKIYRPGGGLFINRMTKYLDSENYSLVLGSVYPNDSLFPFPYLNFLYIKYHIEDGDIIILHDRKWTTPMLEYLLPWMIENNYNSLTLDNLMT